jgi:hypothetical protein
VFDVRKDGQHEVRREKDADRYGDNDGHRVVDGKKEYHEARKKQEY